MDGELLILDMRNNQIHHLNQTAAFLWNEYDGQKSLAQLADALADFFEIDIEMARNDVAQWVLQLRNLNLFIDVDSTSIEHT